MNAREIVDRTLHPLVVGEPLPTWAKKSSVAYYCGSCGKGVTEDDDEDGSSCPHCQASDSDEEYGLERIDCAHPRCLNSIYVGYGFYGFHTRNDTFAREGWVSTFDCGTYRAWCSQHAPVQP